MSAALKLAEIRRELLAELHATQRLKRIHLSLMHGISRRGVDCSESEVKDALSYLEGRGFVASEPDTFSRGVLLWQITSAGIDAHEGHNNEP